MGSITYYIDNYRLCKQTESAGQAPIVDVYNDRRAGMTFPTKNTPGYFCLFGLKDVITHRDKLPLELLAEESFKDQDQLFISLCRNMGLMRCQYVYADCSLEFQGSEIEFEKYISRSGIKNISMWDASEFDGFKSSYAGFDAARAPIDEYGRKGLLKINSASVLGRELHIVVPDDYTAQKPWEKLPAINAFNHIIMSYVISPWCKPEDDYNPNRQEGYGG